MYEYLSNYIGCACEVKTMENDLLAVGKIRDVSNDEDDPALEIISYDGEDMPLMAYGVPVKINLCSSKHGFLGLGGYVYIAHESFWKINNIKAYGDVERRNYYRVKTKTNAVVLGPDTKNVIREFPCTVTSISLSGVLIKVRSEECFFLKETEVEIRGLRLDEERDIFNIRCKVKRVEKDFLGNVFGCEFIFVNEKQADKLCQEIFAKQRLEIQKKRKRL